jgi:DNA-binding CsgD family transcriptional regulator
MPRGALERSIVVSILLNERYDAANIARELGAACSTVRNTMARLYRKYRINTRTHVPHVRLVYLLLHEEFEL